MRKIAVLAATAAVIAAASGLWSTATFDKPKVAGHVQATEAPPVSPPTVAIGVGVAIALAIIGYLLHWISS